MMMSTIALIAGSAWSQDPSSEIPKPQARSLTAAEPARSLMPQRGLRSTGREHPHRVEIDGIATVEMRIASPVSAVTAVHKVTMPNDPQIHIELGRTEYKTIKLVGELPLPGDIYDWFKSVSGGNDDRRGGQIILLANDGSDMDRIEFTDALPVGLDIELAGSRWVMTLAVEFIQFRL
jgi:hypothetical protein